MRNALFIFILDDSTLHLEPQPPTASSIALAISSASEYSDSAVPIAGASWPPPCHSSTGGPWRGHSLRAPEAATLLDPNSQVCKETSRASSPSCCKTAETMNMATVALAPPHSSLELAMRNKVELKQEPRCEMTAQQGRPVSTAACLMTCTCTLAACDCLQDCIA